MNFTKKIIFYSLIIFISLIAFGTYPGKIFATVYLTDGLMTSSNLLPVGDAMMIDSFNYNVSALPAGTSLKIQFRYGPLEDYNYGWYDADGRQDTWTSLSLGSHSLALANLGMKKAYFFYRIWFISNGTETPVLDSINFGYSFGETSYPTGGQITSINLLPVNSTSTINSFSYTASAIPASTSLQVQFSYDGLSWYDSAGVLGAKSNLTVGTNIIDLNPLGWDKTAFYYRLSFLSDGSATPVFDFTSVSVSLLGGINEGSYQSLGILTSNNIYPSGNLAEINMFSYISDISVGAELKIQFSQDGYYWYDASGVLNARTSLNTGTNILDLSSLGWSNPYFAYRIWFYSNGLVTPVLNAINVSFSAADGYSLIYSNSGVLISKNLFPEEDATGVESFSYDVLSLPASTSIKVQFSEDGISWYDSAGILNASSTLSLGTSTIDLSTLGWTGPNFYYKATLISDSSETPVLGLASLNYISGNSILTVSKQGKQIATTTPSVTNQNLGGAFTLTPSGGDFTLNSLKFKQTGSFSTSSINSVKVYYEATTTCSATKPSYLSTYATSTTFDTNNYATTTFPSLTLQTGTTTCLYFTYNLTGTTSLQTLGQDIDFQIINPSTDIVVTGGTVSPATTINIPYATMIVPGEVIVVPSVINPKASNEKCFDSVIYSQISLQMRDPLKTPTVYYLQNCQVYKKEGAKDPRRLSDPRYQVQDLTFTDVTGETIGSRYGIRLIHMSITMSNMDPNEEDVFLNITNTLKTSASVSTWPGRL